jgi:xylan 1,4-beta-xylosidase
MSHTSGSWHPARAGAVAAVLVTLFSARPSRAANYTITVDVARQTAGNPRFWATSVGVGTASLTLRSDLQTHYKIGNRELGFQRVRGHGVLNDDMAIYRGPGNYSWTNFDKYLDAIVAAGMRPIMELSFMPSMLAASGNSRNPPGNYTNYKNFIQAVVQHCVDRYGAADVGRWYWEVWNEWDYAGFWTGTEAEYYMLYDAAVDGITAVLPNAEVGGPASTEPGKISRFLQHCRSVNKRVTFVSSHVYPGGNGTSPANATSLLNDNTTRRNQITAAGYTTAAIKSFNTEWNSSYSGQGGNTGDALTSMDNHWNVGFILKGIKLLSDLNSGETPVIDVFSYWVLSDIFDESSGPSGSYILAQGGNLPFGRVFGLMTFQGVRKAPFNAFKMLAYLGPKRLMSGGGTGGDGVDAMATLSAAGDEVQILVYNYFQTLNTTGTDMVTVNLSNLPTTLANRELFVTHFRADETHSNPYSTWVSQGRPTNPTEAQWQAMKAQQHLALLQPVSKATVTTTWTTSFTMPRQAGSLITLGVKRPVTGRNAFVEIEAEDWDGQSGATKQDSGDTTLGQSITANSGGYVFYNVVDFSDAGVNGVQLRVNAQTATNLQLRAGSQTGALLGTCEIAATAGAWATQTCTLTQTAGVNTVYVVFGGTVRLNWLKFQQTPVSTGTGGMGGGAGGRGGAGGSSGGMTSGAGGSSRGGSGGTAGVTGAGGNDVSGTGGSDVSGTGGSDVSGTGGSDVSGTGGSDVSGTGGNDVSGAAGSNVAGVGGNTGSAGSGGGGAAGCGCSTAGPSSSLLAIGLVAVVFGARRRRRARR